MRSPEGMRNWWTEGVWEGFWLDRYINKGGGEVVVDDGDRYREFCGCERCVGLVVHF